jgi:tripartite-type tricarboxylate transporter receptor subunit TctC
MTPAAFRRRVVLVAASIGLLPIAPATVAAQDQYPTQLIKIVVPFPPGGTPDTMARIVADRLQSRWGKPVIVENRPGATGNLGAEAVAKAEPDGYTLLVAPPPPFAVNQHLFAKLRFDPSAFAPVTVIAAAPNVLVARPDLPAGSVAELVSLAKSRPGTLKYGSTGRGSTMHLSAEMLKSLAGIDVIHVAYKSLPEYVNDMLGGSIDLAFANIIEAYPLVQAGRLKVLGVGSAKRSALMPNVPAIAETIPGFVSTTWFGVAAPPGTPAPIVEKLSSTIAGALREPGSMARLEELNATPILSSPAEAAAFIREESERWRKVIVAAGLGHE